MAVNDLFALSLVVCCGKVYETGRQCSAVADSSVAVLTSYICIPRGEIFVSVSMIDGE